MVFSIENTIILIVIGIASGYLSGLMGLGGGIIIIPSLVYFLGFSQQAAQGTTLGLMVLPIGLLAAFQYHKMGNVDIKAASIIAIAFIGASYYGSKMAISIDQNVLRKIFAFALILIAVKMLFQKS